MKRKSLVFCSILLCFVMGAFTGAMAATVTLEADNSTYARDDTVTVDIYANIDGTDATSVAGCAFTLTYPVDVLTPPATNPDGTPVDPTAITSPFPFTYGVDTTFRANSSEAGTLYLSGAEVNTTTGGAKYGIGQIHLFTVKFTVKADATYEDFSVWLEDTMLFNPAAGYGTDVDGDGVYEPGDGDTMDRVPALVGAVDNTDPNWTDLTQAFPVLLDADFAVEETLFITDGDSLDDQWEILYFGGIGSNDDTTDDDGDGYLDAVEYQNEGLGQDPTVQDEPYAYPGYDPALDTRTYQISFSTPASPKAAPGATFSMDVEYAATGDAQNLSQYGVRVHYDSSILTWDTVTGVFATGLDTNLGTLTATADAADEDGDPNTDMYVQIEWTGGNWPGVAMPLTLFTIDFTVDAGAVDGDTSVLNYTASQVASGYTFYGVSSDFTVTTFNCDIDGDGTADALTDGILSIRYMFGFTGNTLITDAVDPINCTRCTAPDIEAFLSQGVSSNIADIDGNGNCDALTDGILMIRYMFGFTGNTLITDAVDPINCTRCTAPEIESYLLQLQP